jgi:hypothetical protein
MNALTKGAAICTSIARRCNKLIRPDMIFSIAMTSDGCSLAVSHETETLRKTGFTETSPGVAGKTGEKN